MSLICDILGHKWDGCKCTRCGAKRDEGHRYELVGYYDFCQEICSVCGDIRNRKEHDWEWIPEECIERCTRCGITREKHSYKTVEGHPCTKKCTVCGKEITNHNWNGCTCTVCGEVRNSGHDWEWISEGNYTRIRRCKIRKNYNNSKIIWDFFQKKSRT